MLTRAQRNILGCVAQNVIKDGDELVYVLPLAFSTLISVDILR